MINKFVEKHAKWSLVIVAVLLLAAFAPVEQGVQRFKTIISETITNSGTLTTSDGVVQDDLTVGDDAIITGDLSVTGAFAPSGGGSFSPNVVISAPTAAATGVPALQILNPSVANGASFQANLTATPYLNINPTAGARVNGAIIGSASGQKAVCVTQTITGSATVSHGLSTPSAVLGCTLAADPTGDQWCTYTNSAGTVTTKVWKAVLSTPSASADPVSVTTCVLGTP